MVYEYDMYSLIVCGSDQHRVFDRFNNLVALRITHKVVHLWPKHKLMLEPLQPLAIKLTKNNIFHF